MSSFFDKLKEVSDAAGVPAPTLTSPAMTPVPAKVESSPPAPEDPPIVPAEAESGDGLADAADSDCVTPDGWLPPESFDDVYDEEDD